MAADLSDSERGKALLDRIVRERGAVETERSQSKNSAVMYADLEHLVEDPPPPRRWLLDQWMPMCSVVALFGGPGIGKSLLAQQIAIAVGLGASVFGIDLVQGPALYWACEDDNEELRRRAIPILRCIGRTAGPAIVYCQGRAGMESTLVTFDRESMVQFAPAYAELVAEIERLRPKFLVLDNISHLYGGLENDRRQVTAFVNVLTGLARRYDLAILLLGHVAKIEGSEYSGSTAWEAAVRTRLWLERREDDSLALHRRKANYAARDAITLEWQDGAFVPLGATDHAAGVRQAEATVLAGLATMTARQIPASHQPTATSYLPRLLQRGGLLNGASYAATCRALSGLIDGEQLEPNALLGWKKPDRHPAVGLRRKGLL
jgi:RecA-family ATPase